MDTLEIGAASEELSVVSAGLVQKYEQDLSDAGLVKVVLLSL